MRVFRLLTALLPTVALAAVVLGAAPASAAFSTVSGVRLNSFEARLLTLTNAARKSAGVGTLTIVPGTTDFARQWAYVQAESNTMKHNQSLRADAASHGSPNWHYVAENVGTSPSDDPDLMFTTFMQSPEHKRNILDPRAHYIGLGVAETLMPGHYYQAYITMDFVDSYDRSYGPDRVAAMGMERDEWTPDASHNIPAIEDGDQRLDAVSYSGPSAGVVSFTHSLLGIAGVVAFQDTGGSGTARVRYHDSLNLVPGRKIVVTLAAQTRTGGPLRVTLDLHNAAAGFASSPVAATLTGAAQKVTLTVPPHFTQPITEIGVQVTSTDLDALSPIRSQRYARILILAINAP